MGKLLNNDANYRIVAGESLGVQPVAIRSTDGKVYPYKSGVATDTYIGWAAQNYSAGETVAVVRNGKVGCIDLDSIEEGKLLTVGSSGGFTEATAGSTVVGFIPFGGKTGVEATVIFVVTGESIFAGGSEYVLPVATSSVLGGVKQGANVTIGSDGSISVAAPYVLPAAGSSIGGVKKMTAVAKVASADATAAASETITKAEFDAVVALVNENKKQFNLLIDQEKAAGGMA